MILLFACAAILRGGTAQTDYSKTWNAVSNAITTSYYARRSKHEEMERLLAKYKPIASSAPSKKAFEDDVNAMIAEFHDSHFGFFSKQDQSFYLMDSIGGSGRPMPEIGAWFRETPAGYEVQMLLEGSSAEKAGLRKGDLVQTADGAPFSPVDSLRDKKTATLGVLRQGQVLTMPVEIFDKGAVDMFLDATNASIKVLDDGSRKVGYIHVWTLLKKSFSDALSNAVEKQFAKTDAVILDLRDGFGGRPEGFASPFIQEGNSPTGASISTDKPRYQKALIVLINEGSRSAKEILSFLLKNSKRATLIGTTTAGNVLGTTPRQIEDWAYLEIPITDVITAGVRLEGVGVKPDIPVNPEYDPSGKDLILGRALDFIKSTTTI